jgi:hypothetical protein
VTRSNRDVPGGVNASRMVRDGKSASRRLRKRLPLHKTVPHSEQGGQAEQEHVAHQRRLVHHPERDGGRRGGATRRQPHPRPIGQGKPARVEDLILSASSR